MCVKEGSPEQHKYFDVVLTVSGAVGSFLNSHGAGSKECLIPEAADMLRKYAISKDVRGYFAKKRTDEHAQMDENLKKKCDCIYSQFNKWKDSKGEGIDESYKVGFFGEYFARTFLPDIVKSKLGKDDLFFNDSKEEINEPEFVTIHQRYIIVFFVDEVTDCSRQEPIFALNDYETVEQMFNRFKVGFAGIYSASDVLDHSGIIERDIKVSKDLL